MSATAVGVFWGNKNPRVHFVKLVKLHAAIGAYFMLWLLLLWFAAQLKCLPSPMLWILLGAGIGMIIGLEFTCANNLFFARQKQKNASELGTIYAADLLGSCLGALGISVFMIPAYGIYKTLLFLVIINITIVFVILSAAKNLKAT